MMKSTAVKKCEWCGHSQAAHVDGAQCALCTCKSEQREFVQQSLTFRGALPPGTIRRKR